MPKAPQTRLRASPSHRRSEVKEYIERLQRKHPVIECDDGTPVEDLGVP